MVTLAKFKEDLSIGATEGLEVMFASGDLPGAFRETLQEIFMLFESKN
jgi:hypothetical protein